MVGEVQARLRGHNPFGAHLWPFRVWVGGRIRCPSLQVVKWKIEA